MPPSVRTRSGDVEVVERDGIFVSLGIPFAAPVHGLDRWRPPQPAPPWSGVRPAHAFGAIAAQPRLPSRTFVGAVAHDYARTFTTSAGQGDDCLNLNVWTPACDPAAHLPVMFWIHGGGLITGSSNLPVYDGAALARRGVVVVSINYRLGLPGFLAGDGLFDGDVCVGNRGFMDQVAALRWVQENVRAFGGDPDRVTIFGESAGGTSVAVLLAAPSARGLFHRAIMQSGAVRLVNGLDEHLRITRDVLARLGVRPGDSRALAALERRHVRRPLSMRLLMSRGRERYGILGSTGSAVSGAHGTEFLPNDVVEAVAAGSARDVDLVVGTNRDEGKVLSLLIPQPKAFWMRVVNNRLSGLVGPTKEIRKILREQYRDLLRGQSPLRLQEQILTDAMFRRDSLRVAAAHAANRPGRTWVYEFHWDSRVARGAYGAAHALDIPFVFDNLRLAEPLLGKVEEAQPLASMMSETWARFARDGIPAAPGLPEWLPYETTRRETMMFDRITRCMPDPCALFRRTWGEE